MIDRQNKLFSPLTPFETRDRNVTVCPANICCSITLILSLLLKSCLSATLYKHTNSCSQHSRTNKLSLDKCDLTKITHAGYRMPFAVESPFCNTVSSGGGGPKHFPASITSKLWEFSKQLLYIACLLAHRLLHYKHVKILPSFWIALYVRNFCFLKYFLTKMRNPKKI
jgi:hypothetical protein